MRNLRRGLSGYDNPLRRGLYESKYPRDVVRGEYFKSVLDIQDKGIYLDDLEYTDFKKCKLVGLDFMDNYESKFVGFMASNSKFLRCDFSTKIVEINAADGGNVFENCRFNNCVFNKKTFFYNCVFKECWWQRIRFRISNHITFQNCKFYNKDMLHYWNESKFEDPKPFFRNCTINGKDFQTEMIDWF